MILCSSSTCDHFQWERFGRLNRTLNEHTVVHHGSMASAIKPSSAACKSTHCLDPKCRDVVGAILHFDEHSRDREFPLPNSPNESSRRRCFAGNLISILYGCNICTSRPIEVGVSMTFDEHNRSAACCKAEVRYQNAKEEL